LENLLIIKPELAKIGTERKYPIGSGNPTEILVWYPVKILRSHWLSYFTDFNNDGQSGAWVSEIFPYRPSGWMICVILTPLRTDAINHEPAVNVYAKLGSQQSGRPLHRFLA